jgi:DNA-binding MarR family transcriptional regulator
MTRAPTRARRAAAPVRRAAGKALDQGMLTGLVGYALRRAEVKMRQHFARTLAEWDITGADLSVLELIAANAAVTQADLGAALDIKRPNMVSLIDRLARRGLLERKVYEHDRRNQILSLTRKGEAFLGEVAELVQAMDTRVTRCWTAKERAQVVKLLRRFYLQE